MLLHYCSATARGASDLLLSNVTRPCKPRVRYASRGPLTARVNQAQAKYGSYRQLEWPQVVPIGYFAKIASACLIAFAAASSGFIPFWMISDQAMGQTWVFWISE
jgi:hypothetical protein